jgi:hypothetical protein
VSEVDRIKSEFAAREYKHGRERHAANFAVWRECQEHSANMAALDEMQLDPGPVVASVLKDMPAVIFRVDPARTQIRRIARDALGFPYVAALEVISHESFLNATLLFRAEPSTFECVTQETVRVFRYLRERSAFYLCPFSGIGVTGNYIWAHVDTPGTYVVVGLSGHPLWLAALDVLGTIRALLAHQPQDTRMTSMSKCLSAILEQCTSSLDARAVPSLGGALCERGWPVQVFDENCKLPSREDLIRLAERCSVDAPAPELQLLRLWKGGVE